MGSKADDVEEEPLEKKMVKGTKKMERCQKKTLGCKKSKVFCGCSPERILLLFSLGL